MSEVLRQSKIKIYGYSQATEDGAGSGHDSSTEALIAFYRATSA